MATSGSNTTSKPSAGQSVRRPSPRSAGSKLRLAADEGERLRSESPHSPRKPRTSKSVSSMDYIPSSSRSPRRLKYNKSSSIGDEPPPDSLPVTAPKSVPLNNSSKPAQTPVKPSAIRSSSSLSSPNPRSPRLGKTISWSIDSEEDSPRSTKPQSPISLLPKEDGSSFSRNAVSETNSSGASDNDDDGSDEFPPPFSLREPALPDSSSIFQQALTSIKDRKPSLCDPGDLHVRRSSLYNSLLNLTDKNSTPPSIGLDCLFELMSTASEKDDNPRLPKSLLPKFVSNWAGKSRKISAPSKMVTVNQAPPPLTPTPPRRRAVSEIQPPRRELLEGVGKPRPKRRSADSMSASSEVTSSSSQNYVTGVPRPLLGKRSMNHIMKLITNATASETVGPGRSTTPTDRPAKMKTEFPSIYTSGSSQRARNRRDSLRAIQHIITEGNPGGDTTEITSFDDIRNCRYIRDFNPTGKEARPAKRTTYHEW